MKLITEAQKVDGTKVCKAEDVLVCGACGYDLNEAELKLSVCSDCGALTACKTFGSCLGNISTQG
jgi:hypothetical protein